MKVELVELPDAKMVHKFLTIGQEYEVIRELGNGYVIQTSDPDLRIVILKSRFKEV